MNISVLGHKGWIGLMMCELLELQNLKYFTTNI